MLSFIVTVLKLLLILVIIATVHEFGHFLFSKLFRVGVNEFSIGFGPKIVQKRFKGTMYSLRWIPLGGYCSIEGEEGKSKKKNSIENANLIQKILIFAMGPFFNAILSFIIFMIIVFSIGNVGTTKITGFYEDSVLKDAGLQIGDEIVAINGKKVTIIDQILAYKPTSKDLDGVKITYKRDGKKYETMVQNAVYETGYIGVSFKTEDNTYYNTIDMVASGGAAFDAGLKAGDKILSINGVETATSLDIIAEISRYANQKIEIVIERGNEELTKEITPALNYTFDLQITETEIKNTNLYYAFQSTKYKFSTIIGSYVDLFKGKVKVKDMSGIVGIGEMVSKSSTFLQFLNLMGIISLAVGVANILPFPPLDGGKILITLIEAIVKKKLPEKAEMVISYIGFGALIVLTIIVTYRDIIRIV